LSESANLRKHTNHTAAFENHTDNLHLLGSSPGPCIKQPESETGQDDIRKTPQATMISFFGDTYASISRQIPNTLPLQTKQKTVSVCSTQQETTPLRTFFFNFFYFILLLFLKKFNFFFFTVFLLFFLLFFRKKRVST